MTTTIGKDTPAEAARNTLWRTGGILLTLAALLMGSATALTLLLQNSETTSKVYKRPLTSLTLDLDNADVEIDPGPADQVRLVRVMDWTAVKPKTRETWDDGTLRIETRCVIGIGRPCRFSYRLQVPPQIPLTVKADGGDVTARRLTGPVSVDLAGGDIRLDDLAGDVEVANDGGDLRITESRSDSVKVNVQAGSSLIDFAEPPSNTDIRMTAGDLTVLVPSGSAYDVDAESVAGSRDVAVDSDSKAPHEIHARLTAGDLSIRYGSGG